MTKGQAKKTKRNGRKKRINLVTGAAGFCGSYVVRDLLAAGQKVIATDLPRLLGDPDHVAVLESTGLDLYHPNLEVIPANLLEPETLAPLFEHGITHVFHTASLYDYSASLEKLRAVNVDGTRNLLDQVLDRDLDVFVHWSTCGVFGKPYTAADGGKVNVPFREDSSSPKNTPDAATEPEGTELVNDYSITKWEQEKMVWQAYRDQGLPLIVVRPAPMYGPGSTYGHGGIILAIAQGFLRALPSDTRNYITTSVHVEDMARFSIFIADRKDCIGEDYNIVDNSIVSYFEFIQYIALLTGRRLRELSWINLRRARPVMIGAARLMTWAERRLGIPRVRVFEEQSATYVSSSYWLDNTKSVATGFEYLYPDVREGLKETVSWFRRMGWLTDRRYLLHRGSGGSKELT